jgi:hypothetical protein
MLEKLGVSPVASCEWKDAPFRVSCFGIPEEGLHNPEILNHDFEQELRRFDIPPFCKSYSLFAASRWVSFKGNRSGLWLNTGCSVNACLMI